MGDGSAQIQQFLARRYNNMFQSRKYHNVHLLHAIESQEHSQVTKQNQKIPITIEWKKYRARPEALRYVRMSNIKVSIYLIPGLSVYPVTSKIRLAL